MSEATYKLTQAFWEHPNLRRTAQLAIAEIDMLAAHRNACLAACRDQAAWIERFLQCHLEHRSIPPSEPGDKGDGFSGAMIPEWDLRQKLELLKEDITLCEQEKPNDDDHPSEPPLSDHRKTIEGRLPTREKMTKFVDLRETAIAANGGRDPWLDDSEDAPPPRDDHPYAEIRRHLRDACVAPLAGGHPDDCTSVRLDSLRPGAILSTVTGWRGIKDEAGLCCSYDDGSVVSFDPSTPCWEIRLGGWPPRNALSCSAEPANGGAT